LQTDLRGDAGNAPPLCSGAARHSRFESGWTQHSPLKRQIEILVTVKIACAAATLGERQQKELLSGTTVP
jgi:hypothetical protein